jgi:hypothetical protein
MFFSDAGKHITPTGISAMTALTADEIKKVVFLFLKNTKAITGKSFFLMVITLKASLPRRIEYWRK